MKTKEPTIADLTKPKMTREMKEARKYVLDLILNTNLLCQDMDKKLSMWFESKPDAREVFRCGGSVISKKGALGSSLTNEEK